MNLRQMECIGLISACARDTENAGLWSEFLNRYTSSIRRSIKKALALYQVHACGPAREIFGGEDQTDLFQAVLVRLLHDNCAVMRRFSGGAKKDWLPYLASITFSVVYDSMRRQHRSKRRVTASISRDSADYGNAESIFLAREILMVFERITNNLSDAQSARDRLLFLLYFVDDLSLGQIAKCKGLSKSQVQTIISRFINRVREVVECRVKAPETTAIQTVGSARRGV